jgi:ascorbate-specific PTS system EIIC-type component UlaA
MRDKIVHYGIIIFVLFIIFHIATLQNENSQNRKLLEDSRKIIEKQRDVIDAQNMYINYMGGQNLSPIHQQAKPYKGPI